MEFLAVFSGCVIWIPITVMVVSLVHWMIMGEMDFLSGCAGIWFCIWLGFIALRPPDPVYSPILVVVAIATCVMYPFVRVGLTSREHRRIEIDQLSKAYESLQIRGDNPIAQFRVASQLYVLGLRGHAVKIAENALTRMPVATFRNEHQKVKSWKGIRMEPSEFAPIPCVDCGTRNDPGEIYCVQCREPFLLNRFQKGIFKRGAARKVLATWGVLVTLCLVLPMVNTLPPLVAIGAILASFIFAGAALFFAFRPEVGGA